jgi:hypothetical protein
MCRSQVEAAARDRRKQRQPLLSAARRRRTTTIPRHDTRVIGEKRYVRRCIETAKAKGTWNWGAATELCIVGHLRHGGETPSDAGRSRSPPGAPCPRLALAGASARTQTAGERAGDAPSRNFCMNVRGARCFGWRSSPRSWSGIFHWFIVSWNSCWPLCSSTSTVRGSDTCRCSSNLARMARRMYCGFTFSP